MMGPMGRGGGRYGGRNNTANPHIQEEFKKPRKGVLIRLGKYIWHFKWLMLLALLLTIGSNSFALVGPTLSGKAIDCIGTEVGQVDFKGVSHYALLMLLFYLGSAVMSYLLSILMVYISRNVTLRMRRDMFNRLSDMPVGYF